MNGQGRTRQRSLTERSSDEDGFTTVGTAIALLLVFALIFASLNAYWVGTRSGQIQYVADAGALAADEAVADFVTIGEVVDAILLSFTLLQLTVYVVSAVVSFIPGAEGVAGKLIDIGSKIKDMRDSFSESAIEGLNNAQKALPVLCAVKAMQAIDANAEASGIDYSGIAIAIPTEGIEVDLSSAESIDVAAEQIEEREETIQEAATDLEESNNEKDEAKEAAWKADCGSSGMCMRERASTLAHLSGSQNPNYTSVDNWHFSVALDRAKIYYQTRYNMEAGESYDGDPEEIGESVARKRFYDYAHQEVSKGSATTNADGTESVSLKSLARNRDQIKETFLYTESIYPVSAKDGTKTLHAYTGCPKYQKGEPAGKASVADIDSGKVERCDTCKYSATTLGRVPSASTSIDNGFEYYYRLVVEASQDYTAAAAKNKEATETTETERSTLYETVTDALASFSGARYDPQPPGRFGCICVVIAPEMGYSTSSSFYEGGSGVPMRIAISGATLAPEESTDQGDVLTQLAEDLVPTGDIGSGLTKTVFGAWTSMLGAYTSGTDGLKDGLRSLVQKMPVVGNDLSDSVVNGLDGIIDTAGLEPADLTAYKPVLVNTEDILAADSGSEVAQSLLALKQEANQLVEVTSDPLGILLEAASTQNVGFTLTDDGLIVAQISLGAFGLGSQTIDITLPMSQDAVAQYNQALARLREMTAGVS